MCFDSISTVSTNIAFNSLHALIIDMVDKQDTLLNDTKLDPLYNFNVHTRDKVTMSTVSGFLTI